MNYNRFIDTHVFRKKAARQSGDNEGDFQKYRVAPPNAAADEWPGAAVKPENNFRTRQHAATDDAVALSRVWGICNHVSLRPCFTATRGPLQGWARSLASENLSFLKIQEQGDRHLDMY